MLSIINTTSGSDLLADSNMDILIESTKSFESDLAKLSKDEKAIVIQKLNDCADLFLTQESYIYRKLRRLPLPSSLNGYESSLYTLKISQKLRAILSVDEDPIFEQVIFTFFRIVKRDNLDEAYRNVAESLYKELQNQNPKIAQIL